MSMSRRETLIAILAAVMIGIWLLDSWVLTPTWEAYAAQRDQASIQETKLARAQILLTVEPRMSARWTQRLDAGAGLSPSAAEVKLSGALSRWASQTQMTINNLRPDRRPPEKGLQIIRSRVEVTGSMYGLSRFLLELENATMPLRVESIRITCADGARDVVSAQLEVSTLCLAPPEEPSAKSPGAKETGR